MTYFDLSPLYRSTVGFDRLAALLGEMNQGNQQGGYPPYNIARLGEHAYRITMAVAGFGEEDVNVSVENNELRIAGAIEQKDEESGVEYLYQGIAGRSFERRFRLNDHVKVADAYLEHGMLHVDLVREIPEEMKPRRIPVRCCAPGAQPATLEAPAVAKQAA